MFDDHEPGRSLADSASKDPEQSDGAALEFRRQWIVGPRPISRTGWAEYPLGSLWLASHPSLSVSTQPFPSGMVFLLGTAFDPENPAADPATITSDLARAANSKDDLEATLYRLSGRWLLIVASNTGVRIYPDATGSRAVFYANGSDRGWAGSSPNLINEYLDLASAKQLIKALDPRMSHPEYRRSNFWPGMSTPFHGLRRLLPNHYLDCGAGEVCRYWPKSTWPPLDMCDSARQCFGLLKGGIEAALAREKQVYVALTAGYDSRNLLAASIHRSDEVNYFALRQRSGPEYDHAIAQKLASKYRLDLDEKPSIKSDNGFLDAIDYSTGGMVVDGALRNLGTYSQFPADSIFLEGTASEVGRGHYYQRASHPNTVSSKFLCDIIGFRDNPVAEMELEAWLQTLPEQPPARVLDLFYWEIRLGGWCSMQYLGQDLMRDVCSPYNSHAILEGMLAAPEAARRPPFRLHRSICKSGLPGGDRVRYNNGWRDSLRNWAVSGVSAVIPAPAMNALRAWEHRRHLPARSSLSKG